MVKSFSRAIYTIDSSIINNENKDDSLKLRLLKLAFIFITCRFKCNDWLTTHIYHDYVDMSIDYFDFIGELKVLSNTIQFYSRTDADVFASLADVVENHIGTVCETPDGNAIIMGSDNIITCVGPWKSALYYSVFYPDRVKRIDVK